MRRKNTPHGRPIWKKFRLIWTKEPAKRRFLCSFFQSPSRGWKKSTEQHLFLSCRVFRASLSLSLSLSLFCVCVGTTDGQKGQKRRKKGPKKQKKAKKERKEEEHAHFDRTKKELLLLSIRLIFIIIAFVVAKKARRGKWSSIGETEERERETETERDRERTINKKR